MARAHTVEVLTEIVEEVTGTAIHLTMGLSYEEDISLQVNQP